MWSNEKKAEPWLPRAEEAARQVESNIIQHKKETLAHLRERARSAISNTIRDRGTTATVEIYDNYPDVSWLVVKELEELGYEVEYRIVKDEGRNARWLYMSWGKK